MFPHAACLVRQYPATGSRLRGPGTTHPPVYAGASSSANARSVRACARFLKICNPMRPSWFATPYVPPPPTRGGHCVWHKAPGAVGVYPPTRGGHKAPDHPHTGDTITRSRWRILEWVPSGHEHQRNAPSPNEPRRSSTAIPVINRVITDFRGEPTSPARATPSRVTVPWYAMASSHRPALEGVRYLGRASCPT